MRKKLIGLFVLASLAGVLLIPALGVGQQSGQDQGPGQFKKKGNKGGGFGGGQPGDFGGPGGKFGGGQPGGFGGGGKKNKGFGGMNMSMDPDMLFNMMAKGQDAIVISTAGPLQPMLQQYALDNGNTSGVIARADFSTFYQSYVQGLAQGGGFGGGFGGGGGGWNADPDQMAEQRFLRLDRNGDGFLNEDEIPNNMQAVWRQYDKTGRGMLNLDEFKALFRDTTAQFGGGQGNFGIGAAAMLIEEQWDKRPAVFRAGKLPKELPAWFAEYDTDGDGQVGLYEWRKNSNGKAIAEFQAMDRNGDGLLTAEEVLAYLKAQAGTSGSLADSTMVARGNRQPGMGANNQGQFGNFGPGNGKGKGKGGPGGGKGKGGKGKGGPGGGGFGDFGNSWYDN